MKKKTIKTARRSGLRVDLGVGRAILALDKISRARSGRRGAKRGPGAIQSTLFTMNGGGKSSGRRRGSKAGRARR